jgi:hypothetical protein
MVVPPLHALGPVNEGPLVQVDVDDLPVVVMVLEDVEQLDDGVENHATGSLTSVAPSRAMRSPSI